jgi:Mrp family chromosome partitioning ATPase
MRPAGERRRHPRLALAGRPAVVAGPGEADRADVEIRDLSLGGIRCSTTGAAPGAEGREVEIAFEVPGRWQRRVLRLSARIIRVGPEPSTCAFELIGAADSPDMKRLEAFLGRAGSAGTASGADRSMLDRQVAEAFRMIQLGLSPVDAAGPRVVVVTTPTPAATGFLAAGLAVVLAGQGEATIAVDLDLPHPSLHRLLGVPAAPGLADWIRQGTAGEIDRHALPGTGGVRVVPAGALERDRLSCGRPALASLVDALRRTDARYVVIHAPACLTAADAGFVSELADDVLLVLRADGSSEAEVVAAGALLARHGAHLRGVILTHAPPGSDRPSWWSAPRVRLRWRMPRLFRRSRPATGPDAGSSVVRAARMPVGLGVDRSP